ncbi:hypothetical protein BpHYR1_010499 [Brachionus plicatilis]|uniref:Uncharacterized protein n=1 Tax=Brachionus plicatilis TaxID=10195 RepID=A0A3M7SIU7_BRAPC|nr:hypothetical protein BpHYR1_010499 [Brachionus plicatilis]
MNHMIIEVRSSYHKLKKCGSILDNFRSLIQLRKRFNSIKFLIKRQSNHIQIPILKKIPKIENLKTQFCTSGHELILSSEAWKYKTVRNLRPKARSKRFCHKEIVNILSDSRKPN